MNQKALVFLACAVQVYCTPLSVIINDLQMPMDLHMVMYFEWCRQCSCFGVSSAKYGVICSLCIHVPKTGQIIEIDSIRATSPSRLKTVKTSKLKDNPVLKCWLLLPTLAVLVRVMICKKEKMKKKILMRFLIDW